MPDLFVVQNTDDDPADTPDYLNNDFGGPGAVDQWNDTKWVDGTREQDIQRLYKTWPISISTTVGAPTNSQQFQAVDVPDYWVVCISILPTSGDNQIVTIATIGQETQADEINTVLSYSAGTARQIRTVIRGKSPRLNITVARQNLLSSSTIDSIFGTVWAISGRDPKDVGVIL